MNEVNKLDWNWTAVFFIEEGTSGPIATEHFINRTTEWLNELFAME
jgi:hypothetical protein